MHYEIIYLLRYIQIWLHLSMILHLIIVFELLVVCGNACIRIYSKYKTNAVGTSLWLKLNNYNKNPQKVFIHVVQTSKYCTYNGTND